MDIVVTNRALRGPANLPRADSQRILAAIEQVADAHPQRLSFVTELAGRPGQWRFRKADWRALFTIAYGRLTVLDVGHRRSIYE